MGIAAIGNWIFNFALGLYLPPGFASITWKMFIVHGTLCMGAAIQFYTTYPETCGKTLEEIEEMFSKGGPRPWNTRKGESKLDALIEQAREKHLTVSDVMGGKAFGHGNLQDRDNDEIEKAVAATEVAVQKVSDA